MKFKLTLVLVKAIGTRFEADPILKNLKTREVFLYLHIYIETFRDRFYMKSSISKRENFTKSNILNISAIPTSNMIANIYG